MFMLQIFFKMIQACTQIYQNVFTNNLATIHDIVLLSNISKKNDIDIYQKIQ